ncbi:MAG: TetR/AcrR family transcriptional regulator [Acidimicrobiales bacterium]
MPARPLSTAQRVLIRDTVLGLAVQHGFDGWRISDVIDRTGVSSRTLYKYYPSKEYLLLDAMVQTAGRALRGFTDGTEVRGRTPRSRVLRTLGILTEMFLSSPSSSRAMVRSLTCGQDAVSPMLRAFNDTMQLVVARALAGGEPGDPEWAAAGVVQQVWFAAVIAWASNVAGPEHIEESVVRALRLIGVNR